MASILREFAHEEMAGPAKYWTGSVPLAPKNALHVDAGRFILRRPQDFYKKETKQQFCHIWKEGERPHAAVKVGKDQSPAGADPPQRRGRGADPGSAGELYRTAAAAGAPGGQCTEL